MGVWKWEMDEGNENVASELVLGTGTVVTCIGKVISCYVPHRMVSDGTPLFAYNARNTLHFAFLGNLTVG